MSKIKQTATSVKNWVVNHRGSIGFTVGASLGVVLNKYALKEHDDFLTEKGLYDEFYTPEPETV